jgi:hypothetical protein
MTFQRSLRRVAAVAVLGLAQLGLATSARAADLPTHAIDANVNDAGIDPARGQNLVWLPHADKRVGKLLVFLPYGAVNNRPTQFQEVGAEGARLGYHTIVLAYRNEVPIAAPAGCGTSADLPLPPAPQDCAIKARMEILDGGGESPVIDVDQPNSIENRLSKLLAYLKATYADEGWSPFLDAGGTEPNWSETVIAGGSLGAGEAVLIGMLHPVHRVALFAGFTDAKHGWVKPGASPNRYFALIHARDAFFARMCDAYSALGVAPSCPLPDFTIPPASASLVENRQPPFESRLLVFNLEFAPNQPVVGDPYHASTVRDGYVAKEADGTTPSHLLVNAWRSILGDSDADTLVDDVDRCPLLAGASQTDTDADGTGDACDSTPQGTTPPTIAVPGHVTVDATGPAGAAVPFTVTATDDIPPAPTPVCTPSAGSLFAIGESVVACVATDGGGNTANASFLVTVLGAKEQLSNLILEVVDASNLPATVKTQLVASLRSLVTGFDPSKPLQRVVACLTLRTFTTLVRFTAPPAQAAAWTIDANRIRTVLAC